MMSWISVRLVHKKTRTETASRGYGSLRPVSTDARSRIQDRLKRNGP